MRTDTGDLLRKLLLLDVERSEEVEGAVSSVLSVWRQKQRREDDHAVEVLEQIFRY